MDDFVRNKLTEWDLSEWIDQFKDQHVDKECLYDLEDQEIAHLIPLVGPRSKFKKRLKVLKVEQNAPNPETVDSSSQIHVEPQVCPSTSASVPSDRGKRKLDFRVELSNCQSPNKKRTLHATSRAYSEEIILSDVKTIMNYVHKKLPDQDNKLNKFLKNTISDLEIDKREVVGVFGKSGAGKSSLINAVIGVKGLLPSEGSGSACTSVMIKVEANAKNPKYEAHIEFITQEEWKDELWSFNCLDQDDDDDTEEKLSAVYGEEWKKIAESPGNLMDNKYFREIPEFLLSKIKVLTGESAKELSAKFVKYTRRDSKDGEDKDVKRWYWPLVKCVTVRVPKNDLLQHVTVVDLPGNGDRNRGRDEMWKRLVGSCSTVWIVTDRTRAAAEKEAWDILKSTCSLMGNGGECQQILFICTKTDIIGMSDDHSAADVRDIILEKNNEAKRKVRQEFHKLNKVKNHFSDDCFEVFTVSSKEYLEKKHLDQDDTEIPRLKKFLQDLNNCHSETLNYVSRACGILSLIQGASRREGVNIKRNACTALEDKMRHELDEVRKPMEETVKAFEACLSEGVEQSISSCEKVLKSVLFPNKSGSAFHRILTCVVENRGTHKPKNKKQINLNMKLSSCLTDSIDEEFKKTFPNDGKCEPFNGAIKKFSLGTEEMKREKKYEDIELQLNFLKTEEENVKAKLSKIIRERKKTIYRSLTTTIEETMQECYNQAKEIRGQDMLKKMRNTIMKHVYESKNKMFMMAKQDMLFQLSSLMDDILEKLGKTMLESIELSLKTDGVSIPDVTEELRMVKSHYRELMGGPDEEPIIWVDPSGPAAGPSGLVAGPPSSVAGQRSPAAGQRDPVAGQRDPGAGQRDPGAGQRDPGAGQRDPVAGQRDPVAGQRGPAVGQRDPVAGQRDPVVGQRNPGAGQRDPVAGQHSPASVAGQCDPVAGQRNPVAGQRDPVAGQRNPVAGQRSPATGQRDPAADQHSPASVAGQYSPAAVAGRRNPVAGQRNPGAGQRNPVAGRRDPVAGQRHPVAGQRDPVAGRRDPVAGQRHPVAGHRDPVAGRRDPVAGRRDPVAGRRHYY